MKRLTLILMMLSFAVPTWALAELEIHMEQKEENGQSLTVFSAEETQTEENTPAPDATPNPALLMANGLIESCFEQTKAAQLTQRAGNFLVSRTPIDNFTWDMLKGTSVLGGRAGGMPEMVFEYILKMNGLDPKKDVNIIQNIDFGVTAEAFVGGTGDYTVEFEPHATGVEKDGSGAVIASLGVDSGYVPYTCFSALESYMNEHPDVIQSFVKGIQKGLDYVNSHSSEEIAKIIQPQFEETDFDTLKTIVERYHSQDTWKKDTVFTEEAFELLQNILEEAGVLEKRVDYDDLVTTKFSK